MYCYNHEDRATVAENLDVKDSKKRGHYFYEIYGWGNDFLSQWHKEFFNNQFRDR